MGFQKIGRMVSGPVDDVLITGPPWKIRGGVPTAGSLALRTHPAPAVIACAMPPIRPTLAGTCACDAHARDRCGPGVAACAEPPNAAKVATASSELVAAARNAYAPRFRRCGVFMVSPTRRDPGLLEKSTALRRGSAEHILGPRPGGVIH